jgi:hypothetical protein
VAAAKRKKEAKNALEDVALVAGTQQNLSNLYSLDIYGVHKQAQRTVCSIHTIGIDGSLTYIPSSFHLTFALRYLCFPFHFTIDIYV